MDRIRLTTAQALVHYLARQHTERDGREQRLIAGVWAIFGHGNVAGLGQALEAYGDVLGLPTYRPQNEQAMVHAAAAFAKHRNRMSTFACASSIGPGATNMITGAAGATINRLPVLLLPSDYFASRVPDPVLQQLEHESQHDASVNDAFRPVSRFFTRISRPEQLLSALPAAMAVLTDPARTGAVTLALPEDVQAEAFEWPEAFFRRKVWHVARRPAEAGPLEALASAVRAAERPLIVAGGGVIYSEAGEALRRLVERFGIPVAESQAGKGALPWDHPLNLGPVGANGGLAANRAAREADLVLAVGTRLGDFVTASRTAFADPRARIAVLNVDVGDANKLGGLGVVADARAGLEQLLGRLADAGYAGASGARRGRLEALRGEWTRAVDAARAPLDGAALGQGEVIGAVNGVFGGRATMVCAAGSMPGDLLKLWRAEDDKAYHVEYGYSCMGYEIPGGVGVALAEPGRKVVVMVGDGSYLMMNAEIVTAVAEGLDLTVVVVDNGAFGSIRGLQRSLGSPVFNNERRARDAASGRTDGPRVAVDFAAHAEAMGARAFRCADMPSLASALRLAREAPGVKVLDVKVALEPAVPGFEGWWEVPPAETSDQAGVRAAREAYERDRARQILVYPPAEEAEEDV
ncbi:MAG TPA: 3D-(3,5/4)-trihydroxycyclohexane-1,2-dione acylhydrolase (decyclizing) [Trueperaceae bacterium]|nr:3D-(3,5/4)-trihydroxycyclohexane-1,2-dione acylhydrolase (decyclizing) [Trueperaceae bacterium]